MPINSDIYFQQQSPDIVGSISKGLSMRQMLADQSRQNAIKDAYKQGLVANPDGTTTVDNAKTMSALAKADPQTAMEFQKQSQANDLQKEKLTQEKRAHTVDMISRVAPGIKDQASYDEAMKSLQANNVDVSQMPKAYDPALVDRYHSLAISAKDQQDQADKQLNHADKQKELGIHHEEVALKRDQVQTDKIGKLSTDLKNDLDADRGRSGNFGQISAKVQQADRLKTLVSSYKNGDLPPQQMEELALGMANMLSGSSGAARSQVEALVPHTWWGGKQSAQQWLMNEPMGAGQQKFVEAMAHTIDRERDTANEQLNNIRASRITAHEQLKKLAPDQYERNLRSYGIDPSRITKDGKYLPAAPDSGLVLMKDPQGNIRQVKADLVEAAKKAGGTVVTEQVAEK
jgi:hypothetical protein